MARCVGRGPARGKGAAAAIPVRTVLLRDGRPLARVAVARRSARGGKSMERRRLVGSRAAVGGAAAVLAKPHLANAQATPRLRSRCPNSFPKSVDTIYSAAEI